MAKIASSLFGWQEVEAKSDLARLKLVLEYLPDEQLMRNLEAERGRGRNDDPVRCVWNAILAGVVYQHDTIEKLRRELHRNAELRQMCGFDVFLGSESVPKAETFSRFFRKLIASGSKYRKIEEYSHRLPDPAISGRGRTGIGQPSSERKADWMSALDSSSIRSVEWPR